MKWAGFTLCIAIDFQIEINISGSPLRTCHVIWFLFFIYMYSPHFLTHRMITVHNADLRFHIVLLEMSSCAHKLTR